MMYIHGSVIVLPDTEDESDRQTYAVTGISLGLKRAAYTAAPAAADPVKRS